MPLSHRQITCVMTGATRARRCSTFEEAEAIVARVYPEAHRQGSAGGWSWSNDEGVCVAATCFIEAQPYGRHWLALRDKT